MAVSINMRGKAATSGGAGGGGKSKLRRDWDALLDSPNPNTQQRFEEDFAMADPDSNMFNAKKILSNRNNLKNYANKSIPESRMNAMAAKIAAKQMKPLQDHISKTLDREITRLSRQTRPGANIGDAGLRAISERQSRITNAMATMARLTGGKYALPVVSQEVLSHAQSRIGAIQQAKQAVPLLPMNAHVNDFRQQQAKWMTGGANSQVAVFRQEQAKWMKNPANAHILARDAAVAAGVSESARFINATGNAGQSAAFSGDRRELRKMEKNLDRIAANSSKELEIHKKNGTVGSVGYLQSQGVLNSVSAQRDAINRARAFSPNAHRLRGGIGGLAEGLGLGAMLENPIGLGVAAAGAFVGAPFMMSAAARKIVSSSSPYATLSQQMGRYGRAYGFNKSSVMSSIMPSKGVFPEWMLRSGITQQEIPGLLSSYGVQFNGKAGFSRLMGAVGFANNLPGFGGMNKNVYAGLLGQGKALGITGNQSDKQYLTTFGRVVQSAVKEGMNRSQVVQFMQSSISGAAGGGALSINKSGLLGFGYRMMGSGAPGARTGASVLNFENQLNAGASAVGKMPVQTMMYYQYMKGKTMKQILGSSYGSVMGTKAGRYAISSAQGALSHGSPWFAVQDLAQAAKGHPNLQMRILKSYMAEAHLPSYMAPELVSALGLTSLSGAMEYGGRGPRAGALQGPLAIKKATMDQVYHYETWSKSKRQRYRVLEATTAAREMSQELKAHHGSLRKALNEYSGPGNHADSVLAVANARKIGWKGGKYFDKKKESIYRKELKAAGVPANEISAMISAGKTQNIDPMILYGIHTTQASNWGLLDPTTGADSSAHGPFQTITKYADAAWKGHPNQIRRYNKLASIAWATPGKLSDLNLGVRGMNATAQGQGLSSSKIIFETLGQNLISVSSGMKDLDTAVGVAAKSVTSFASSVAHSIQEMKNGHFWEGAGNLITTTSPGASILDWAYKKAP